MPGSELRSGLWCQIRGVTGDEDGLSGKPSKRQQRLVSYCGSALRVSCRRVFFSHIFPLTFAKLCMMENRRCEIPSNCRQMLWNANCTHSTASEVQDFEWAPNQPAREGSRKAGLTVIHRNGLHVRIGFSKAVGLNIVCCVHHSPLPLLYCAGFSA